MYGYETPTSKLEHTTKPSVFVRFEIGNGPKCIYVFSRWLKIFRFKEYFTFKYPVSVNFTWEPLKKLEFLESVMNINKIDYNCLSLLYPLCIIIEKIAKVTLLKYTIVW